MPWDIVTFIFKVSILNPPHHMLGGGSCRRDAAVCVKAKRNVAKVLLSLRGTHDPAVTWPLEARGVIDSLVLNCMFELISTLALERKEKKRGRFVLM